MKVVKGPGGLQQTGKIGDVADSRTTQSTPSNLQLPASVRLKTSGNASNVQSRAPGGVFALRVQAARLREADLSTLETKLNDPGGPVESRAKAGIELATRRLQRDLRPDAAEDALSQALELSPGVAQTVVAQLVRANISLARADTRGAQAVLRRLQDEAPNNPEVQLLQAELQRQNGDPAGALGTLAGLRAVVDAKAQPGLAARVAFTAAYASFAANRPQDTIRFGREAFSLGTGPAADTRIASKASQLLRELLCPDFGAAHRPEVEAGLTRASAHFQAGDWDAVQAEAQAILDKDPNEALAFNLFAVAEQRRIDTRPLIGTLATPERQAALVKQLESVLAESGATPKQLFADWQGLNDLQKAKAAHSALLYGDLLPEMMARRPARRIHLVPPGESCTTRDADTDRSAKHDAFGRQWYGTRGWVGQRDVVIGIEDLEAAAHGGYDTLTHELAHLAQFALQSRGLQGAKPKTRIAMMLQGLGPDQVRSFDEALNKRFSEARMGVQAQPVTDYAGTCVEEYFAESMMAAASDQEGPGPNRTRLVSRDPKMAKLAEALFEDLSRLPP